jgi:hypothetical protein
MAGQVSRGVKLCGTEQVDPARPCSAHRAADRLHPASYWKQKGKEASRYYDRRVEWLAKHAPTANLGNSIMNDGVWLACGAHGKGVPTFEERICIVKLGGWL